MIATFTVEPVIMLLSDICRNLSVKFVYEQNVVIYYNILWESYPISYKRGGGIENHSV